MSSEFLKIFNFFILFLFIDNNNNFINFINMNKLLNNKVELTDVLEGLKKIDDNSIDIIIADPPYNIKKDFGEYKDNLSLEDYLSWCDKWITESLRVLKPQGTLYVYGFSEVLASIFANTQCNFKKWIIWHYANKNVASSQFWQRSHESIAIFAKSKPYFNRDDVREPYSKTFLKNSAGKQRTSTKGRFNISEKVTTYNAHENGALPRDVIKIPALAGGSGAKERIYFCQTCNTSCFGNLNKKLHLNHDIVNHPTQKPIILTNKLILAAKDQKISQNNLLILFSGSGSECISAIQQNCNFLAFETNPLYQKMSNDLIDSYIKSITIKK